MNYLDLLNIRYKVYDKIFVLITILIIFTIYVLNKEVCSIYNTYSYVSDDNIIIEIPATSPDILHNLEYIKIDDDIADVKVTYISEVMIDTTNKVSYQQVLLSGKESYQENQILKVTIYYDKEKVIEKLKELIF